MSYPLPTFHFHVDWGGTRGAFTEVTGLDVLIEAIEYREGSSADFHKIKMPGLRKFNNITLRRGILANDHDFFNWINTQQGNTIERRDVTISLLNERHEPVMTWRLQNAFPVRYSGPDLKAGAGEVAIEELELTHEGLVLVS